MRTTHQRPDKLNASHAATGYTPPVTVPSQIQPIGELHSQLPEKATLAYLHRQNLRKLNDHLELLNDIRRLERAGY